MASEMEIFHALDRRTAIQVIPQGLSKEERKTVMTKAVDGKKSVMPNIEVSVDDIWNMKDSDDFLRYLKFEAINYTFLLTMMFISIILQVLDGFKKTKLLYYALWMSWGANLMKFLHLVKAMRQKKRSAKYGQYLIVLLILASLILFSIDASNTYHNREYFIVSRFALS